MHSRDRIRLYSAISFSFLSFFSSPLPQGPFRIRFYICLCLFLCYVILDYTKASFYEVDSARIYAEVRKDLAADMDLEETLAHMLDGIWVSENAQEDTGGLYTEP